ncbi:transcriptional regulator, HxlR family [Caldanaerobius fijiensis DSM 17918]|uniref:Transcriptional regulator, HxlR family n=1 Tax=Caldanaerobius fijiensis DSM 17918 TaxID=1121256 RepID=A0A1M5CF58_9THEO|nr:helix-turn-helix domain-containing protein [Caldanaerobius fijiensis]SHF53383.1 transcriptional regulator, HxlR family [Caldanaerobius fijiensis DSM 17918]
MNSHEEIDCQGIECSIEKALSILEGKWTFLIIKNLFDGKKRFGELRKSLDGISPKTLSQRLKELEQKGIINRTAYPTIPPTVEYSLTEKGKSLKHIIVEMKLWGAKWG